MANPDYIINKQVVSTTQSIPISSLSIDELTAPGIMSFQRLIEHWQQKHGIVLRNVETGKMSTVAMSKPVLEVATIS